jgi:hypothetical protein
MNANSSEPMKASGGEKDPFDPRSVNANVVRRIWLAGTLFIHYGRFLEHQVVHFLHDGESSESFNL